MLDGLEQLVEVVRAWPSSFMVARALARLLAARLDTSWAREGKGQEQGEGRPRRAQQESGAGRRTVRGVTSSCGPKVSSVRFQSVAARLHRLSRLTSLLSLAWR